MNTNDNTSNQAELMNMSLRVCRDKNKRQFFLSMNGLLYELDEDLAMLLCDNLNAVIYQGTRC